MICYIFPALFRFVSWWKSDRNHHLLLVYSDRGGRVVEGASKMASQEESLREFIAVSGVDEERARFFLESAGWNLQVPI